MASQDIAAGNSLKLSSLKFGAIIFNEKHITIMEKFYWWPIFKYHLWCNIQEKAKYEAEKLYLGRRYVSYY
jgi:hypothetical protein